MQSSVPPPPPPGTPTGLASEPSDIQLIRAEARIRIWFAYYFMAFFGVISVLGGIWFAALFVIACIELVRTLWRPTPKLFATSYNTDIAPQWQSPMRVLRLSFLARDFAGVAWGFVVTTVLIVFVLIVMWPTSFGLSNLIVLGLFAAYFGGRPVWYPAAKRWLGPTFKGVKKELAKGGPQVRLVGDGIDVYQPVHVWSGPPQNWLWHVAFAEISELRTLGAMDAQAYWGSLGTYDPSLQVRAGKELYQYMVGKTPRPAIYQYMAAGLHLLVRGPNVLYLLAYADESGPAAVSAWERWRAAQGPAQTAGLSQ